MNERDFATLLLERIKEIAREVLQEELEHNKLPQTSPVNEASIKLRQQITLIKAKEHITVKEAALLLSCSESHIRKLVRLARKNKSRIPIPFVDMDGVTVFPLQNLLSWAAPTPHLQIVKSETA